MKLSREIELIGKGLAYENVTKAKTQSAGRELLRLVASIEMLENKLQCWADAHNELAGEAEARALLAECVPHVMASHGAEHMLDGFRPQRRPIDDLVERLDVFMRPNAGGKGPAD